MPSAVTLRCPPEEADLLLAACLDFDTTGVEQNESGLVAHFESRQEAERFAREFHHYSAVTDEIAPRNWAEEWQQQWRPSLVGRSFYLSPPWNREPAPQGRIVLEMRPGLVFGGGDHPTTQLCLGFLEDYVGEGITVADIGCGSGILGDAALKLGAGRVVACDIEFAAAEAACTVLHGAAVYCGSVDALKPAVAGLIVANLLTGVVAALLPRFAAVLAPGGKLILSGFLVEHIEAIDSRAQAQGLRLVEGRTQGDWAASVYVADPIRAAGPVTA